MGYSKLAGVFPPLPSSDISTYSSRAPDVFLDWMTAFILITARSVLTFVHSAFFSIRRITSAFDGASSFQFNGQGVTVLPHRHNNSECMVWSLSSLQVFLFFLSEILSLWFQGLHRGKWYLVWLEMCSSWQPVNGCARGWHPPRRNQSDTQGNVFTFSTNYSYLLSGEKGQELLLLKFIFLPFITSYVMKGKMMN